MCRHIGQITISVEFISTTWDVKTQCIRLIQSNMPLTNKDRDTDQNWENDECNQTEAPEDNLL